MAAFGTAISLDPMATLTSATRVPVLTPAGALFDNEQATLASLKTFVQPAFNVRNYGAIGDGLTNDLAAFKLARDAAAAAGGGRVYCPPGAYKLEGDGLAHNPANGVIAPIVLEGDGPLASRLIIGGITNPEAILLSSQSAMGSGANRGFGVRNLSITAAPSTNILTLSNLEAFDVENVVLSGGAISVTVSECRLGNMTRFLLTEYATSGIKVIGEVHADNAFSFGKLVSSVATGHIINWTRTTTAVVAGGQFNTLVLNGDGADGFHFEAPSATNLFINIVGCAVDDGGAALTGNAVTIKKSGVFDISNCFFLTHGSGKAALECDAANDVRVNGGNLYTDTGACADVSLKNACSRIGILGSALEGPTQSLRVDATTHTDTVWSPSVTLGTTLCNDWRKIFSATNKVRHASPGTYLTDPAGGAAGALGLLNNGAGGLAKYFRIDSTGRLVILNSTLATSLLIMADSGALDLTLGSLVSASLGSGTVKFAQNTNDATAMALTLSKSRNNAACSAGDIAGQFDANFFNTTPAEVQAGILRFVATTVTAAAEDCDLAIFLRAAGTLAERWRFLASGALEGSEMTAPAAPGANKFRLFAEDNGSGKTRLMVQFATGAAQQIAIQP